MSCAKGVPITAHQGFSRKRSFVQHCPQSVPGSVTFLLQPAQTGGNRSRAGASAIALARPLISNTLSATTVLSYRHDSKSRTSPHLSDGPGQAREPTLQPIFDQELMTARKLRALAAPVPGAGFLMERAAEDLQERLGAVERRFEHAAALFCVTAEARAALIASGKVGTVTRVEADAALLTGEEGLVSPPDRVPFEPESIDLAISLLSLHEANDIPGMLIQFRRALRPDGLFLGALAGAGTLAELRESLLAAETEISGGASPRVMPFTDVRDAGALLQRAGFALPVADVETVTVRYQSMLGLLRDIRAMGSTNALLARSRKPATRRLFGRAAEIYAERFSDPDGRVRATFALVWLSGWAPHASQQKPLKPGSAEVSLASILSKKG